MPHAAIHKGNRDLPKSEPYVSPDSLVRSVSGANEYLTDQMNLDEIADHTDVSETRNSAVGQNFCNFK